MSVNTCGFYLFNNKQQFLIGHVTNAGDNIWSIPKGACDDESFFSAAIRELKEETNIDFLSLEINRLLKLPKVKFKPVYSETSRVLISWFVQVESDFLQTEIKCNSFVEFDKGKPVQHPFPEFDCFKWIKISEAHKYLSIAQSINLPFCEYELNQPTLK